MIFLFLVRFHPDMLSDSNSIGKPFRWASESEHYVSKGFHNVLSLISIASNELESDSISGWNLTQAYNNRLDLGAYRTYYKGFTCFFNNTVLRGAGLNGCAIFVRKYWDRTVWRWCIFYFLGLRCFCLRILGLGCFEMMHFLLSGSSTLPLNQQLAGATGFFRTSSNWGVPSVCFLSSRKRVGSLGGKGLGDQTEKKGFQFIWGNVNETQIIVEAIADTMIAFGGSSEWFADWIGIPSFLPEPPAPFLPNSPPDRQTKNTHPSLPVWWCAFLLLYIVHILTVFTVFLIFLFEVREKQILKDIL